MFGVIVFMLVGVSLGVLIGVRRARASRVADSEQLAPAHRRETVPALSLQPRVPAWDAVHDVRPGPSSAGSPGEPDAALDGPPGRKAFEVS